MRPLQARLSEALANEDYPQAITWLELMLTDPEADPLATHVLLAKLHLAQTQEAKAHAHFERALNLTTLTPHHPQLASLLEHFAWLLHRTQPERALHLLDRRSQDPLPREFWVLKLHAFLLANHQHNHEAASECWRQALSLSLLPHEEMQALLELARLTPDDLEHQHCMAKLDLSALASQQLLPQLVLDSLHRPHLTLGWLSEALTQPSHQLSPALQVLALRALRRFPEALALARLHVNPLHPEGQHCMSLVLELALHTHDLALALETLTQLQTHTLEVSPELHGALAEALFKVKRYDEAQHHLSVALAKAPQHVPFHLQQAALSLALGDLPQAGLSLEKARLQDPLLAEHLGFTHHNLRQHLQALEHPHWPELAPHWPQRQHLSLWHGHNARVSHLRLGNGEDIYIKAFLPQRRSFTALTDNVTLLSAFTQALKPYPLVTSEALPTTQGQRVIRLGEGFGFATKALPGRPLSSLLANPRVEMHSEHAKALGRAGAYLQKAARSLTHEGQASTSWSLAFLSTQGPEGLLKALHQTPLHLQLQALLPRLSFALESIHQRLRHHPLPSLQWAHGDFSWHNVLWSQEAPPQVLSVLDFDYAHRDVPFADLFNAVLRTAWTWKALQRTGDPQFRLDLWQGFWAGVHEVGAELPDLHTYADWMALARLRYYLQLATATSEAPLLASTYGPAEALLEHALEHMHWLSTHASLFSSPLTA